LCGCTSVELKNSTIGTASTLTDLEYEMVLDNVAMLREHPDALPWHVKLTNGSVEINDSAGPSYTYNWPIVSNSFGFTANRSWQESWTTVPVVDATELRSLRSKYATFVKATWIQQGIPPLGVYSGRFGATVVWVKEEDVKQLSDATLAILEITKVEPGERAIVLPVNPQH
jgi:hypothetical protein